MPPFLIPLIAAGASFLGRTFSSVFSNASSARANRRNIAFQREANIKNRKFAVSQFNREKKAALNFWNMQNNYNLPANQMKRLKSAGLNPNLVYGGGATTLASSPSTPSASAPSQTAPHVRAVPWGAGLSSAVGSSVSNFLRFSKMKKSNDLTDSQVLNNILTAYGKNIDNDIRDATKSDVINTVRARLNNIRSDTHSKDVSSALNSFSLSLKKKYGAKRIEKELSMMAAKIDKISADTNISNFNYQNMVKYGIFPSDHVIRRTLIKNLVNQGITPDDFIGWLLSKFGIGKTAPSIIKFGIKRIFD